ncbi:hypothetical protein FQA39_LY12469 [Lamprigera yunnana]|nr:hypothetical protein FQA39_LY12469 [Lamprigera yunnana]
MMRSAIFVCVLIGLSLESELFEYKHSNILFSSDLYKKFVENSEGNSLICPLSAQTILSLVTVGGKENTLKQLSEALHIPSQPQSIKKVFDALSPNFDVTEPYQFKSANRIYLKKSIQIKTEFEDIAKSVFKADIKNINFSKTKKAAAEINTWVEGRTDNKIKNLIGDDALSADTVAVLVNALYFHGNWIKEFGKGFAHKFYISENKVVTTDFMSQRKDFNYYKDEHLNAQFLEMPFVGNDVVMTFVLPNDRNGLPRLEKMIEKVFAVENFANQDVVVSIPKFKIESKIDVKKILQSLGVEEPFTTAANFKGISDTPLLIDKVIQKTFLEINERGATAAAATGLSLIPLSTPRAFFIADHPFLFYLKHKLYGVVFVGRFCKP